MDFYLLRIEDFSYDSYDGHVVLANGEVEARQAVTKQPGDEGSEIWLDEKRCSCTILEKHSEDGKAQIILSSFNAG